MSCNKNRSFFFPCPFTEVRTGYVRNVPAHLETECRSLAADPTWPVGVLRGLREAHRYLVWDRLHSSLQGFSTDLLKCSVVREHRADFLVRDNGHFLFQLDWRCSLGNVNWRGGFALRQGKQAIV